MQPEKKTEADLVVTVPLQKIGGRLVKCSLKLLIKCFLNAVLHYKMSCFFFFLAGQFAIRFNEPPFLKFPNKYRIYTCCLHCRPSTFPHADVTLQGEGYLNSSISCMYVHAHTHAFLKGYHQNGRDVLCVVPGNSEWKLQKQNLP